MGYSEATLRPQVQLSASINLNLPISDHILFIKYLSPLIWHRNGSVFNIHRWILVFRREKQFVIPVHGLQVTTIFVIQESCIRSIVVTFEPCNRFTNCFFLLKTEIHSQILNTYEFCTILGSQKWHFCDRLMHYN